MLKTINLLLIFFFYLFLAFLESTLNFQCSEQNMRLISQVFLKIFTPKDKSIKMDTWACFLKPCGSERVNESQNVLKSAEKYFYNTFSSIWAQLSSKRLFLRRSQILGLLVNPLTAIYEYSHSNRENIPLPIQIKFSKKA